MNKFSLQKFNLSTIKNVSVLMIGHRASGKTFLTKKIINQNKTLDSNYVIFENNYSRGSVYPSEYTDITQNISNKFDSNKLIYLQDNTTLVCDNMLEFKDILTDISVKHIYMNNRHINTCFIFTHQYPYNLNLVYRNNLDYIFLFNDPSNQNKKKMYELYIIDIVTFDIFVEILESLNKYECLVIDKINKNIKLYDQTQPIDQMLLR
jgi:nicotinamide riboside kinase